MKNINKIALFVSCLAGVGMSGCSKDFLDVNTDPNRVTDSTVTAELIFPSAAEGLGAFNIGSRATAQGAKTGMQWAESWIGYQAANGDFSRDAQETSYNLDFTFNDVLWQTNYGVLFDLHQAEVKGLANNDTALAAAAIILSAKGFQDMVDMWGNIPYSQAFKVQTTTRPAYDKAQDIYNSLLLRLDTAIAYMGLTPSSKFAKADIVNHGDTDKWIKFANTLKLRLLIRQSEVPGFDPAPEIAKIFGAGSPGILKEGETVSVNPGYANDVDKQSPFYANYGYTPTGAVATSSQTANQYIIDILSGTEDPRLERFFTPTGNGSFVGAVYGDQPGNLPAGNQASYFGPGLIDRNASAAADDGYDQDQWIIPSYESLFFYAEAVARGWVPSDANAQAAYEAAVTESFVWLGVTDPETAAADYMAANEVADWAQAGTSTTDKVKFIAFQKYIANTCIDPLESFSDQRRLKFLPAGYISVNPSRVSNTLPLRLLYPQSEYTTNSENVLKEGTIDPFTSKIFWEP